MAEPHVRLRDGIIEQAGAPRWNLFDRPRTAYVPPVFFGSPR
jgi:hypothetical protein